MRELDLLFGKFLDSGFESLDDAELGELEKLLNEPDQDILAWLSASRNPPGHLDGIIARIRRSLD